MYQINALHGDKLSETPREWNRKPPEVHFKLRNAATNTSPVVSAIMGRLNHHAVDNADVELPFRLSI